MSKNPSYTLARRDSLLSQTRMIYVMNQDSLLSQTRMIHGMNQDSLLSQTRTIVKTVDEISEAYGHVVVDKLEDDDFA